MDIERRTLLGLAAVGTGMTLAGATSAQTLADGGKAGPADPTEIIHLWPQGAPGGESVTVTGAVTERSTDPAFHDRFAQYTTDPILTVFRPERPNGTALLLIPGGGYRWAVLDKEGYDVARVFAATGTTCFVLRYRLPDDGWAAHSDAPLQDAQRAMRIIRHRAAEFGVDPAKVGLLGASAGGHLGGLASARTDATYANVDVADAVSFRPDFSLLMYPVATMRTPHVHAGSRDLLLGKTPTEAQLAAYSLEEMDWKGAAPVWLVHAMDDVSVPVENSLQLLARLKADGVKAEAHLFQEGSHGFGIRLIQGRPAAVWPELARAWAARAGFAL